MNEISIFRFHNLHDEITAANHTQIDHSIIYPFRIHTHVYVEIYQTERRRKKNKRREKNDNILQVCFVRRAPHYFTLNDFTRLVLMSYIEWIFRFAKSIKYTRMQHACVRVCVCVHVSGTVSIVYAPVDVFWQALTQRNVYMVFRCVYDVSVEQQTCHTYFHWCVVFECDCAMAAGYVWVFNVCAEWTSVRGVHKYTVHL